VVGSFRLHVQIQERRVVVMDRWIEEEFMPLRFPQPS